MALLLLLSLENLLHVQHECLLVLDTNYFQSFCSLAIHVMVFHRTKASNLGGNQFIEVFLLWVMFWFHVEEYPALVSKSWHVFLIDYNLWEVILPSACMLSVPQRARWTTRNSTRFTGKSHQVLGLPSSAAQTSPISSEIQTNTWRGCSSYVQNSIKCEGFMN